MASDSTETLTREEAKRILRRLELEAYAGIVTAFRAQGDLNRAKKQALQDLASQLSISAERHKAELRRAVNDEQLNAVAECINGPSSGIAWCTEGRQLISMLPRLVPQTALSAKATVAANTVQVDKSKTRTRLVHSTDPKAMLKNSIPEKKPELQSPVKAPHQQKLDLFNNNVNTATQKEGIKASDFKIQEAEKSRKKKRHQGASKIQPTKMNSSLLVKSIPKGPVEAFKSAPSLPLSVSPSKSTPPGLPKFHSKPIILQRSSPFKSSHTSESNLSTSSTVATSTTGITTLTLPASTFSIPTRPTITSFTTSPSGGLIPVQYNSATGISTGMSSSKVKFKAPMPRQRGKPSKFKTIGPGPRSVPHITNTAVSDPINVLATPTGIPITPISPNKTQISPVSTISTLTQATPSTVKVIQIPKSTAPVATTTVSPTTTAPAPAQVATTSKITNTSASVSNSKSPAQRVLTFSNIPGHSGQQLKIASIPNVLQQSGALASNAKLVSISKSVPMATGFKMIAVTTMVPGSSQVKTVYIATPIMSLTKSVTHGTGSIISTSVHNRKRVASTSAGVSAAISATTTSATTTSAIDLGFVKGPNTVILSGSTVTTGSSAAANLAAALSSKAVSSILSSSSHIPKDRDLLVISPLSNSSTKINSTSANGIEGKEYRPVSSTAINSLSINTTSSTNRITETPTLLAKQISDKRTVEQTSATDKELLSAGDAFIANLTAKLSKTNNSDSTNCTQLSISSTGSVMEVDQKVLTKKVPPGSSTPHDKDVSPIDLSAKETLDGEEHNIRGSSLSSTFSNVSPRTGNVKNSVMFLSSEDGIWSGSNTLWKSDTSVFQTKKGQSDTLTTGAKKPLLIAKTSTTSNCVVAMPPLTPIMPVRTSVCQCRTGTVNSLTISTRECMLSPSISIANTNSKVSDGGSLDSNMPPSPDRKKQKLIQVPTVKGDKINLDTKSGSSARNCQKFELVGGEKKSFNQFIPIQNQSKEPFSGTLKIDSSSHYTSTLRDLNKLFFNQLEPNCNDRKRTSEPADTKSVIGNGPVVSDTVHVDTAQTSASKVTTSPHLSDSTSPTDSCASSTSGIENDFNSEGEKRLECQPNFHPGNSQSHLTRKRKFSDGKDSSQRYHSGWVRSAQLLLQKVSRYRGTNKQKGEMNASSWFARPVDPEDAPNYYKIIKKPMDFSTIRGKLESGTYHDYTDFFADMQLIKTNCHTYNPPEHPARKDCDDMFSYFEVEYKKTLERWQRCHVSPNKKLKGPSNTIAEEVSSKT